MVHHECFFLPEISCLFYRNPAADMASVKWDSITSTAPAQYLSISADPQMRQSYSYEAVAWNQLITDIERDWISSDRSGSTTNCEKNFLR